MTIIKQSPTDDLQDQNVTLQGDCYDAKLGAVILLTDRTPIYVANLSGWPSEWMRKTVHATGILTRRSLAPNPVTNTKGEVSHGMAGDAWVLKDAKWVEV